MDFSFCNVIKWRHIHCPFQGRKSFPLFLVTNVSSLVEIQRGVLHLQLLKVCLLFYYQKMSLKQFFFPLKAKSEKLGPISPNDQGYKK